MERYEVENYILVGIIFQKNKKVLAIVIAV